MKATILLISAFLGLFILSSCSNNEDDDNTLVPYSRENRNWGYFKGTINGKEISLENERNYDLPVWSPNKHIIRYYPSEEADKPDSIKKKKTVIGMSTEIKFSKNESMGVYLFNLYLGKRYITHPMQADFIYDRIGITRCTNSNEGKREYIRYVPEKENPFRAEIINIEANSDHEITTNILLEVKLDGVLYRSDNPKDSIIIRGTYGVR